MSENMRSTAVGYALVDQKVFDDTAPDLPDATEQAANSYLSGLSSYIERAGGSVANTMAAYERYSGEPTRLYYTIASPTIDEELYSSKRQTDWDRPKSFRIVILVFAS